MAQKRELTEAEKRVVYDEVRAKRQRLYRAVEDGVDSTEEARRVHAEVDAEREAVWKDVQLRKAKAAKDEAVRRREVFVAAAKKNDWVTGSYGEVQRRYGDVRYKTAHFVAERKVFEHMPKTCVLSEYHGKYDDAHLDLRVGDITDVDAQALHAFDGKGLLFTDAHLQEIMCERLVGKLPELRESFPC